MQNQQSDLLMLQQVVHVAPLPSFKNLIEVPTMLARGSVIYFFGGVYSPSGLSYKDVYLFDTGVTPTSFILN